MLITAHSVYYNYNFLNMFKGGVCFFFLNALENWVGPSTKTNL